jgi:hypothetical protein
MVGLLVKIIERFDYDLTLVELSGDRYQPFIIFAIWL